MDQETEVELLKARGGIWLGWSNGPWPLGFMVSATWPFTKLELKENGIVIKTIAFPGFSGKLCFAYEEIIKIEETNLWIFESILGHGIRLYHNKAEYPSLIKLWLWPKSAKKAMQIFNAKLLPSAISK